jgi:threonine dehydratase
LDVVREVVRAEARISGLVRETPLERSPFLSREAGCEAFVKLENLQHTGSFKLRGALSKLRSLTGEERRAGVVAASSGNHGAAVAFGARQSGAVCTVFVPEGASETKVRAIRDSGAEVRFNGQDAAQAEALAREFAAEVGAAYVSPYNDPQVIGGQGTIGAEIARRLERPDVVFVPVGGGGLVSGVAGYLKAVCPGVRVVGCSPQNSAVMAESVRAGEILELESRPTLSDGTAGGLEPGAITFDLCREYVDEFVLVSEEEIAGAMRSFMEAHHMLVEGAAGVALAAFRRERERLRGRRAVVVVCGANISLATLRSVL